MQVVKCSQEQCNHKSARLNHPRNDVMRGALHSMAPMHNAVLHGTARQPLLSGAGPLVQSVSASRPVGSRASASTGWAATWWSCCWGWTRPDTS